MSELNIKAWMNDKVLLITGATGFLGKVLVEKLLRECCTIKKIYIIVRARDKFELFDRFIKYRKNQVFNRLSPNDLNKLHPVLGDLMQSKIGLSENDRNRLISEVNVVIHSGASVKFNENFFTAVKSNVHGTRELANLAKMMIHLNGFVHISTAFSNSNLREIEEKIYEPKYDPETVVEICEQGGNNRKELEDAVARLYPNTYIFTKNLSEKLITNFSVDFPVAVVRPSIITPSQHDPYPGWMDDSKNGPMGLMMGGASGLIRAVHGSRNAIADFTPVDKAANAIIAAAVHISQNSGSSVYNLTTSNDAPITWHKFLQIEKKIILENPFPKMVWYPDCCIHEYFITYLLSFVAFQLAPAALYDSILYLFRKSTWMVRFQVNAFNNLRLLSYFLSHSWTWNTSNCNTLHSKLNSADRNFNFRQCDMNYEKYLRTWHAGSKKYHLKVEAQASKAAFIKLRIFYCFELLLKVICYAVIGYGFSRLVGQHHAIPISQLGACSACTTSYTNLKGTYLQN